MHTEDPEAVRKALGDTKPPLLTFGKVSLFPAKEGGDYDVVKIDIEGDGLHALNKQLADSLEHTSTHPVYKPHCTLAYVLPGKGQQHTGDCALTGKTFEPKELVFSAADDERHMIPLGNKSIPFSEDKEDNTAAVDADAQAAAEMLADILYGVYGHEALTLLGADSEAFAEWQPLAHPRGPGGRFIKKGSGEAADSAKKALSEAITGKAKATAHDAETLLGHLALLNVKQLQALHKEHGIKAPARLRQRLVDSILSRIQASGKKPDEAPKNKPTDPASHMAAHHAKMTEAVAKADRANLETVRAADRHSRASTNCGMLARKIVPRRRRRKRQRTKPGWRHEAWRLRHRRSGTPCAPRNAPKSRRCWLYRTPCPSARMSSHLPRRQECESRSMTPRRSCRALSARGRRSAASFRSASCTKLCAITTASTRT